MAAKAKRAKSKAKASKRRASLRIKKAVKAPAKLKKTAKKAKIALKKAPMAKLKGKVPQPPKQAEIPQIDPREAQLLRKKMITVLSASHVRQMLIELGGENALAIVRNFYGNQSDEEMAKKLKIKISDVRATLNKLHNEGLVNYIREKDSETGWYSYSWSLNHERMERWATAQSVRPGFGESGGEYYFCPSCGTESITNFESATECEFRCERCNKMLEYIDESGILELFEKKK